MTEDEIRRDQIGRDWYLFLHSLRVAMRIIPLDNLMQNKIAEIYRAILLDNDNEDVKKGKIYSAYLERFVFK